MVRSLIFFFFFLFTTSFIWANDSNNFIENEISSLSSLLSTCTISIGDVQGGSINQTVTYQETIEPIIISFETDCNEALVLNFATGQLPTGSITLLPIINLSLGGQ